MSAVPLPRPGVPRNWLARLVSVWAPPQVLDFWTTRLNPLWSLDRPLARVTERRREAAGTTTLLLRPNRHWKGYRPGQHVNLTVEIDGVRLTRSYSPSDIPRADGRIAITVKAVEGGRVSRFLQDVAPGTVLDIGPAFGEMTLPPASDAPWLFLAAGNGITPLLAMTRQLAAQGMPVPLTLLYWARRRDELCRVEELRALATTHPGFRVRFLLTGEAAQAADEDEGRIGAAQLAAHVSGLAARRVCACGPNGFVAVARNLLEGRAKSFAAEAFTPPPRMAARETGTVRVTLARSGCTLDLPRGVPLLEALEAEGIRPRHGCRMGICNTCACGKREGSTRNLHSGEVQHEPTRSLRLCINSAGSDLVLDL